MPKIKTLLQKYNQDCAFLPELIALTIKHNKEFIYSHPRHNLNLIQYLRLVYYLHLAKKNYSLARLAKHKEFFGWDFSVNKHTLIPRPETELIVEELLKLIDRAQSSQTKNLLIDIGTGSGCIPIAFLKQIKNHQNKIEVLATDISSPALKIAQRNSQKHKTQIKFIQANLFAPLEKIITQKLSNQFDNLIITANLPYLTPEQFLKEPSVRREPKTALLGGTDGLELYTKLLKQISAWRAKNNTKNKLHIFLEIDPAQAKILPKIKQKYLPDMFLSIKKDLAGQKRLAHLTNQA
ncbi:MAG: hypothetical protein COU31_03700 [Candidatus Magasanikbacteria bacterium CG10_big_fil_rev_8_21_14_0_10_40_10]|uniref:peptide chain release factor N(5)-glutamine methyltransferase n=1 Tax=Candidatus Magasanikbacteria bacterium CG10_big_fil_rev_8_21_14_0_10_40_10 TaxID=1974648 RepID=A0A2M6W3D1_9BACT|nr:MAG: hypothetical protein COU31_03700 [Candidatus Magasanikbacteria bacterium CG10_big_fil_rev_8_21_14_0_10_40_10]